MHRGFGRKCRLVLVKDTMVYIPILKTIEVLLKDEGYYAEVIKTYHIVLLDWKIMVHYV